VRGAGGTITPVVTWTPLAREELDSMISSSLSEYDKDVGTDWERIRIEPAKWQCSPWGDQGGGFWAVAIEDTNVLWYNDIEEGFNWSRFTERGVIDEYWCNQNEFDSILEDFAQARSKQAWQGVAPGDIPTDLRGPGSIGQRQTTYWELESSRGSRYRVNFRDKAEFAFAGDAYQQALLLDQHPLLLDYKEPIQTIMISGRPSNPTDLVSKLDEETRTQTDGWRSLSSYENMDSAELLQGGHGLLLTAPEPVCAALMPLLNDAGAKPYNSPGRSVERDDNQRLLLLGGSYVIARAFAFASKSSRAAQVGGAS